MSLPTYRLTCTRKRLVARDVYELAFQKPEGFTFKPGQFVLFQVPLIEKPEDIQTRAFSLASLPADADCLFVMKMKEGGRASRWIAEALSTGTEVNMQGPFGNFVLDRTTTKDYLFIATSAGIAPFRSQILSVLQAGDTRQIDCVFGVRSEEDLFWQEQLTTLTTQYENFFLHLALSNPLSSWVGHRGRVQTLVPLIVKDFSQKNIYVCGSPDMTKEVKELCLTQWGIEREDLHVEGYI